jgi:hypothetical protein
MTLQFGHSNDDEDENTPWFPPLPSLASRHISLTAREAGRSIIPAITGLPRYVRMIQCESLLEGKAASVLLTRQDVVNLVEQPPAVTYYDEAQQCWKRHFFDYLADMDDGTKIAIAIRPEARASQVWEILKLIARQVRGFADSFVLITDADLTDETVKNAELILSARRDRNRSADATMRGIVDTLNGATTVATLVKASGLEDAAFRAIARLIDEGDLEIGKNILIDYRALVWKPTIRRIAA